MMKKYFIAVDAGGSKTVALLFDSDFNLIGTGRAGGVNLTQTTLEDCRQNVSDCLDMMFSETLPDKIEHLYITFVGPVDVLRDELKKRTVVVNETIISEGLGGVYAGALTDTGITAVSGTGATLFYSKDGVQKAYLGGWGPVFGDGGSGTWIGCKSLDAAVKYYDGVGEKTLLTQYIKDELNLSDFRSLINRIYSSVAPFRTAAKITEIASRAAHDGDEIALSIFKAAAHEILIYTMGIIKKFDIPKDDRLVVCCGGAWKAHPIMFETYKSELQKSVEIADVIKPCFEHVMSGPAMLALEHTSDRKKAAELLKQKFSSFCLSY